MSNTHVVVGTGTAAAEVILEGLKDILKDGDIIAIPWYGTKPVPEGLEEVYDYVLEEEISFVMVHPNASAPPKAFNVEHGTLVPAANVNTKILRMVDGKGVVLFLWDDSTKAAAEESEALAERVFDNVEPKTLVLELTNGLAPISFDNPEPPKAEPEEEKEEPEEERKDEPAPSTTRSRTKKTAEPEDEKPTTAALTRPELEGMPVASLKRMAKANGLPDGVVGKENYIKVILGEELPAHAYPPGQEPSTAPKTTRAKAQPVTVGDSDPTQPAPTKPTIVGIDELRKSLYNQTPDKAQVKVIEAFRDAAFALGEHVVENIPVGRNRSLALKALEDVVMRGVKGILLDG